MKFRNAFDRLATPPKKQYTPGQALFGREDFTTLPFNNGGRVADGMAVTGAVVLAVSGNPLGLNFLSDDKVLKLIGGAFAEMATQTARNGRPRKPGNQGFKVRQG